VGLAAASGGGAAVSDVEDRRLAVPQSRVAMTRPSRNPTLAIVGGGPAGLAAAVAAAERGLHVELFEKRRRLGGRAGSFRDPRTGGLVDYCQHVAMGCCRNLLTNFCHRTNISRRFPACRRLHFFGPEGRRHDFAAGAWLPVPFHLFPGLMRLKYLTLAERLGIIRAIGRLAREPMACNRPEDQSIGEWLRRQGQSDRAIERFWSVVLVSALGETTDRTSAATARKVFIDGFLLSRDAHHLFVPDLPLGEILDRHVAAWLSGHNVAIHRGAKVERVDGDAGRATAAVLSDGTRRPFDFIIVAVPWRNLRSLLPEAMRRAMPALEGLQSIRPAPITAVHLWFDRPLTPLPHAILVGRVGQWVFNQGYRSMPGRSRPSHYYQVVISASHQLAGRRREEVLAEVCAELKTIWPHARDARLLHWRVVTQPAAVFSPRPGVECLRPPQQTPIENLMLAGDWTATGWPATMESAVRSGYLAVERVLKSLGRDQRLLVAEPPRSRLVRALVGNA
jgi:squalene-associated FAD-dependent desaturase